MHCLNIHEFATLRTVHKIPLNDAYSLSSLLFSMWVCLELPKTTKALVWKHLFSML